MIDGPAGDAATDLVAVVVASATLADVGARAALHGAVVVGPASDADLVLHDLAPYEGVTITPTASGPHVSSAMASASSARTVLVDGHELAPGMTRAVKAGSLLAIGESLIAVDHADRSKDRSIARLASTSTTDSDPFAAMLLPELEADRRTPRGSARGDDTDRPLYAPGFLRVRLGTILQPERATAADGARRLAPIMVDLAHHRVLFVGGDEDAADAFLRAIVVQLAALRSPSDLRISHRTRPDDDRWSWLEQLPHHEPVEVLELEIQRQAQDTHDAGPRVGHGRTVAHPNDAPLPTARPTHRVMVMDEEGVVSAAGESRPSLADLKQAADSVQGATLLVRGERLHSDDSALQIRVAPDLMGLEVFGGDSETLGGGWRLVVPWPEGLSLASCHDAVGVRRPVQRRLPAELGSHRPTDESSRPSLDVLPDLELTPLLRSLPLVGDDRVVIGDSDPREEPDSTAWEGIGAPATIAMGAGQHVLLAGATGAGKSVALETLVQSAIASLDPERWSLLLVDFKVNVFEALRGCAHVSDVVGGTPEEGDRPATVRRLAVGLNHLLDTRAAALAAGGPAPDYTLVVVLDELAMLLGSGGPNDDLRRALGRCLVDGAELDVQVVAATQGALSGLPEHWPNWFVQFLVFRTNLPEDSYLLVQDKVRSERDGLAILRGADPPRLVRIAQGDRKGVQPHPIPGEAGARAVVPHPVPPRGQQEWPSQTLPDRPAEPLDRNAVDARAVIGWRESFTTLDPWVLHLEDCPLWVIEGTPTDTAAVLDAIEASLAERRPDGVVVERFERGFEEAAGDRIRGHLAKPSPTPTEAGHLVVLCDGIGLDREEPLVQLVRSLTHHQGHPRVTLVVATAETIPEAFSGLDHRRIVGDPWGARELNGRGWCDGDDVCVVASPPSRRRAAVRAR